MAYRRFVTYLFHYQDGKKEKNCGFAKVEIKQNRVQLELQVRGVPDGRNRVYLFAVKDGHPEGVYIQDLNTRDGAGRERFSFDAEPIGASPFGMDDIKGLYITSADGFLASQWVDAGIQWDDFQEYTPAMSDPDAASSELQATQAAAERAEDFQADCPEKLRSADGIANTQDEPADTAAAESPLVSSFINTWEKQWHEFAETHPLFCPFDETPEIQAAKMDLRDFRLLPKTFLPLANNSFLLHGYFNYKYLLFGYMEQPDGNSRKWFLGVPGVFENQEKLLAGLFGFREFRTKHLTKQKTGEFGYWYRFLEL